MNKKALILGVIVGAIAMRIFFMVTTPETHDHDDHEHIGEVHVHSDFLIMVDGKKVDLTQDKYQSTANDVKLANLHLHDNQGNIIHRHAEGLTLGDLLRSIGFKINNDCLTLDTGEEYCANETKELTLYVNGEKFSPIADYINQEADRVLLYYGDKNSPNISEYENDVTDEACIYTGTCPERGTPPPEACGLTCEVPIEDTY